MRVSLAIPSLALAAAGSAHAAALAFNPESVVDTAIDILESFYPHDSVLSDAVASIKRDEYLEVHEGAFHTDSGSYRKKCVLYPVPEGQGEFDDDNFHRAVKECGNGGIISLPAANYTINSPMTIHLNDALLSVPGFISFSSNITHWVEKRVAFEFQNLALGWIIEGNNYVLDGHGSGGIYGNGQEWYNWAKEEGNKYGRPMSLAIANSTNVTIQNWSVIQPQFWAGIVIKSENVLYKNYYVNATNFNPEGQDALFSWVQNTDGCDTYASNNVTFDGMIYQGGDDCLAFKPNSTSITARNVTCYGGTGIAFGSIAQYKDQPDYLSDIHLEDITLRPSSQHLQHNGLYFKSWIGYEIGHPPNGGGGGIGKTRNITARNVNMKDNHRPIFIQTNLVYLSTHVGEGVNTGKFEWTDIHFSNITGTSLNNRLVWLDCSSTQPCHNITFEDFNVKPGKTTDEDLHYVCNNVVLGGKDGMNGCHPSNSTKEGWQTGKEDR